MSLISFLFSFQGRIRRLHLWLFILVMMVIHGGLFWQFGHILQLNGGDMMSANVPGPYGWSDHMGGAYIVTRNPFAGLIGLVPRSGCTWLYSSSAGTTATSRAGGY